MKPFSKETTQSEAVVIASSNNYGIISEFVFYTDKMDDLELTDALGHRWSSQNHLQNNSLLQNMSKREKKRQGVQKTIFKFLSWLRTENVC